MMIRTLAGISALGLAAACTETATAPATAADAAATPVAEAAAPVAEGATPMPAGLSGEERLIWNSMTEAARAEAAVFIANGGTLTQFVAV